METLTFDLESRSEIDLRKRGAFVYAEDPSTEILCFAFQMNDDETFVWIPEKFADLYDEGSCTKDQLQWCVDNADEIEAHNVQFELAMWDEIMVKRHGFKPLPFQRLRCSAAKAASFALPRSLEGATSALMLEERKDMGGKRVMLKMCKPRKPTKASKAKWHVNREDFNTLVNYCKQDVRAERALSRRLLPLSKTELEVFRHDLVINRRGFSVDVDAADCLIGKIKLAETGLLERVKEITGGEVSSVRQIAKTLEWLESRGVKLKKLTKDSVEKALEKEIPEDAKEILEIRQKLGKASVSKLDAMRRFACRDGRVRGALLYHGASTGRTSGKGVQPQNFPRKTYSEKDVEAILELDNDSIEMVYDHIFPAASRCLRAMIKGSSKKSPLFCADFSQIEARVLAWLAFEEKALEVYRKGKDVYKVNASEIYGVPYDEVTSDERQVGKACELALGYQGWTGAFETMAKVYGVNVAEDEAKRIILAWRESRPMTVKLWRSLEAAAIKAVREKKVVSYGRVKFGLRANFLHIRLPSGRLLAYYDPKIKMVQPAYGEPKAAVTFMGVDAVTKKWVRSSTYGGKWTENIVQAIARDLLVEAMLRLEKRGYKIVLHVHDEAIAEPEPGFGDLNEFIKIMSEVPIWAKGIPIAADGWKGYRYRK